MAIPQNHTSSKTFKYSPGLQVLRGVAALMIVFLHLSVAEGRYGNTNGFQLLQGFRVGAAGVDIFFVISGFVMMLVTNNRINQPVSFIKNRFSRIYPNYWVYFVLVLITWMINSSWVNSSMLGTPEFLSSFFLWPTPGVPVLSVAWTLEFEIFFYIVFGLFLGLKTSRFAFPLISFLSGLVVLGAIFRPEILILERMTHPLLLEFSAGILIGQIMLHRNLSFAWLGIPVSMLIFVANQAGFELIQLFPLGSHFERVINYGIPSALLVIGVIDLDMRRTLHYPSLFIQIGNASYTLYLAHILVIAALGKIWVSLGLSSILPNLVFIPILLAACLSYALLAYRYLEQPLLKLTRNRLLN